MQQYLEPEVASVQALLGLSDILYVTDSQRYHALWLFQDKLLPALTSNQTRKHMGSTDRDLSHELPLLLFAVASLLIAIESGDPGLKSIAQTNKQNLTTVYTAACSALDDSFSASYSSTKLLEAAAIVNAEVKTTRRRLTSDYLLEMHAKIEEAGLATLQCVKLETCYMILELLYASKDYRKSQPLECGGKLLAAAIIATAFAITVIPSKVTSLPFLSWLSDLSKHPKEVIKAQTVQVLAYILQ